MSWKNLILASQAQAAVNPELYTTANVVAIENEASSLTGISEVGGGTLSIQTTGSAPDPVVSYARLAGVDTDRIEITWSGLTIGQVYTFSIAAKVSSGGGNFNVWTGVEAVGGGVADPVDGGTAQGFSNTAFQTFTWNLQTTATSGIVRIYLGGTADLDVDSFSIKAL